MRLIIRLSVYRQWNANVVLLVISENLLFVAGILHGSNSQQYNAEPQPPECSG